MDIYDVISAHEIEMNDQILHNGDPIEVRSLVDDGNVILVKGYSHMSGDDVTVILQADTSVELWAV